VWLIEVNTNPYLGLPNQFIEGLLPKMLNDLMEIVLDPYIKPVNQMPRKDYENQFELLYDEKRKTNMRNCYTDSIYPISELKPVEKKSIIPTKAASVFFICIIILETINTEKGGQSEELSEQFK
jgi:hypothetical protein